MPRNTIYLNTEAIDPANAVVTAQEDTTAADFPVLTLGDSPEFSFLFTDGTASWPAWAGDNTYTLYAGIGTANGAGFDPLANQTTFATATGGWTGRIGLNTQTLNDYCQAQGTSQEYPVVSLWLQLRVMDPSGFEVSYALVRVQVRLRNLPDGDLVSATALPAGTSATAAATSAAAALVSENAAASSASNASTSASTAATKANEASASATASASSASASDSSATASAGSASTAGTSASTAASEATAAAASATGASNSAAAASGSASSASDSEDAAAASAGTADTDATAAGVSAAAAAASETAAGLSETNAGVSGASAESDANAAAASANLASTSADESDASAVDAAVSATLAQNSIATYYEGTVAGGSVPATATDAGSWYLISAAGTSQTITWAVGDMAVYDGTSGNWTKLATASYGFETQADAGEKFAAREPRNGLYFDGVGSNSIATISNAPVAPGTGDFQVALSLESTSSATGAYVLAGTVPNCFSMLTVVDAVQVELSGTTAGIFGAASGHGTALYRRASGVGTLYWNGAVIATGADVLNYTAVSSILGRRHDGFNYTGHVDNFNWWNVAQTDAEISDFFTTGRPAATDYAESAVGTEVVTLEADRTFNPNAGNWQAYNNGTMTQPGGAGTNLVYLAPNYNPAFGLRLNAAYLTIGQWYTLDITLANFVTGTAVIVEGSSTSLVAGANAVTFQATATTPKILLSGTTIGFEISPTFSIKTAGLLTSPEMVGAGTIAPDRSGNGADLTLGSNTVWAQPSVATPLVDDGAGGFTAATPLTLTDTTASTSTTTGALVVAGGVGVAGKGHFGSELTTTNLKASGTVYANKIRPYVSGTGYFTNAGGSNIGEWVQSGGNDFKWYGPATIGKISALDTTLTLNALDTAGGSAFMAWQSSGSIKWLMKSKSHTDGNDWSIGKATGLTTLDPYLTLDYTTGAATLADDVTVEGTTASTSSTSGALTVAGGVGVAGELYLGGNLRLEDGLVKAERTGSTDPAIVTEVIGEAQNRLRVLADGTLEWGDGSSTQDTNLYRSAANVLKTDDALAIASTTASTSTTTGALTVAGGVGVAGAIYAGGGMTAESFSTDLPGSDSVDTGGRFRLGASGQGVAYQLSASGHLDQWIFSGSSWVKAYRLDKTTRALDLAGPLSSTSSITSVGTSGGIGYAAGAGGSVTQLTSRTTGVTINRVSGRITLVSVAGTTAWQTFTVTNSAIAANDTIILNQFNGADLIMLHVTAVTAGSFNISFATTGGTTADAASINFNVIKGTNS